MKKKVIFNIINIYRSLISIFIPYLYKKSIQNKLLILIGLVLLSLFSFTTVSKNLISNLSVIDLTKLPTKEKSIHLSQFASEITYLPLETNPECLIGGGAQFNLFDSIIVCSAFRQVLTFDSKNGKFVSSIGEYGNGAIGYMSPKNSYIKNGETIITALGWDFSLIEFSTKGEILTKLKLDKRPRAIAWLSDNLYAIYYKKVSNSDNLRLQIYDYNKKEIVSTFYDKRNFEDTPRRTTNFGAFFYYYKNKLYIKEFFNDTIFQITTNKLIPTTVFKSGRYSPPFYEKHKFDFTQYHNCQTILETEHLIFFRLNFKKRAYYCYFDKRTKQVMIPNNKSSKINGFENDIDGFMPFYPTSISNRNELIGILEPYRIRQWIDENPNKAAKLPQHLEKFKNIKETDNPVLMLVKLKE